MPQSTASIAGPLSRGLAYAFTSLLAHFAGYLLQAQPRDWNDAPLVAALWVTTLPFFLAYSIAFSHDGDLADQVDSPSYWAKENSWRVVIGGAILLTTVLLLLYRVLTDLWPRSDYWIVLGFFGVLFLCYGSFTLVNARAAKMVPIRHQLVWPVAFSIALPLYSGAIFGANQARSQLFWPPLVLVAYFLASSSLSKKQFVVTSGALSCLVVLATVFTSSPAAQFFPLLVFYLAIAAYLAVFEAWAVTSALTAQKKASQRFYLATFSAQLISALSLPFLYALSDQGYIFAGGLLAHCLVSLGVWFWVGDDLSRLSSPRWLEWKTLAGFLFLMVIVVDSAVPVRPTGRLLSESITIGYPAFFLAVALALLGLKGLFEADQFSIKWLVAGKTWTRRNLLAAASGLAIIMMGATVFLENFGTTDVPTLAKADIAFVSYLIASALCLLAVLLWKKPPPGGTVLGVLLSLRLFTCSMVALVVLLPSLLHGRPLLSAVLFEALPFALAAAGGFLLNDGHDWSRDRVDKPHRPVPRGLMTPFAASLAGYVFLSAALVLTFADGFEDLMWILQFTAILGVAAYNTLVDAHTWAKGLIAATISLLPVSAALIVRAPAPGIIWLLAAAFFFLLSRELLMDVLDMKGDASTSRITLAVRLGRDRAEQLASALLVAASVALTVGNLLQRSPVRSLLGALALLMFVALAITWRRTESVRMHRAAIRLSWAPMLVALLSIL